MTEYEYNALNSCILENAQAISAKKSKDYANNDVLSNFKRVGAVIDIYKKEFESLPGSLHYNLFLLWLKIDRLINLVSSGKSPENESITDTIIDMVNYTLLLNANIRES
jgi:hypothetical protein